MNGPALQFELTATDPSTGARLGKVTTRHGSFDTPAFMPVGTQGTIKGLTPDQVAATGSQCILANTYHLMLRPGEKVVAELGDLHRFMAWPGPILTDSGGFQVFSLADLNKITDDGVTFKSHIDGAMVHLDPRRSMEVQNALGADIIMAFDECPAADAPKECHVTAVERTLRWARQCVEAHKRPDDQSLFGIVQGGTDAALRERCAAGLVAMDLPGYALGGLAVGEGFEAMKAVLKEATPVLPVSKPRYLMGVGFPRDIAAAVAAGIDMFDCVLPTRKRPQCLCVHERRADPVAEQPFHPRNRADRGGLRLLCLPAFHLGRDPTLFFSPVRCLARCSFRCIISGSTNGSWRTSAKPSPVDRLAGFSRKTRGAGKVPRCRFRCAGYSAAEWTVCAVGTVTPR